MLEFSSIIAAVKPKERTDQYVILAALFVLGAQRAPVTTAQITRVLRLHLPKSKLPTNVTASLSAYTAYVAPAAAGPPRQWSLTQAGVQRLRSLSGLALAEPAKATEFQADVGFVCALEHPELAALTDALGGASKWKPVGDASFPHIYREASLELADGRHLRVISTTATSMGLTAAAIVTTHMAIQFRPRLIAMVGIAAGTRAGGQQFGDVLVADPSVDYNSGKVSDEGGIREFLPDPYPIGLNPRLRSLLQKYRANHPLFEAIRARWKGPLPEKANRLHLGPLGAADQVINDANRVLEIRRNWRKLIGVEMETYGVYRACHESPEPKPRVVSFKAVCDFAAEKTDSWQDYAAFVAAQFAVGFLKAEWDELWPKV